MTSNIRRARFGRASVFALGLVVALLAHADSANVGIADGSVMQPATGSSPLDFTLTRSGDSSYAVAVPYTTADGTAIAGADYTATSGSATIPAGASTATVAVPVLGGSTTVDKTFLLNLAGATGIGPTPTFAAATTPSVGHNPQSVAVGDFNGDGKPDLATANESDKIVSVLLNTTLPGAATPSYTPAASFSVGRAPDAVAVADFNGDGRPDLAVANFSDNSVSILLNTTAPGV